jgi:hypothetical protein
MLFQAPQTTPLPYEIQTHFSWRKDAAAWNLAVEGLASLSINLTLSFLWAKATRNHDGLHSFNDLLKAREIHFVSFAGVQSQGGRKSEWLMEKLVQLLLPASSLHPSSRKSLAQWSGVAVPPNTKP